eukprot:gene2452-1543_t
MHTNRMTVLLGNMLANDSSQTFYGLALRSGFTVCTGVSCGTPCSFPKRLVGCPPGDRRGYGGGTPCTSREDLVSRFRSQLMKEEHVFCLLTCYIRQSVGESASREFDLSPRSLQCLECMPCPCFLFLMTQSLLLNASPSTLAMP